MRARESLELQVTGNRPAQEDAQLVDRNRGIFVVADGFGGPKPGADAARVACQSVKEFLEREAGDEEATMPFFLRSYYSLAGNVLFNALIHANRQVLLLNKNRGINERGGASVISGYLDGELLALANVGACSAVLFRGGQRTELVTPRTYQRLKNPFPGQAASVRIPLMALGITGDLEPEIYETRVAQGDWLLFHTADLPSATLDQVAQAQLAGQVPERLQDGLQGVADNLSISLIIL